MRVTMLKLREGGRLIRSNNRAPMDGHILTKQFIAGESLVKVFEFVETMSHPGKHELSDPKVKECPPQGSTIVFSGLSREDDAWVAQEWLVDFHPPRKETPVGTGWIKPDRRYDRVG